ncbi:MAG: hypothetical protein AABZ02_02320 [Bacteroidota bacterium]
MNKKVWIGFVAVFITFQVLDGIVNFVILDPAYKSISHLMRPEGEMKLWLIPVIGLFFSFFFTFIFSKGYEGKGLLEGVRYGLYVGLMVALPMAYGSYAMMPIPYSLALQWFIYGTLEYMIAGVVLALIFKPKEQTPPVA